MICKFYTGNHFLLVTARRRLQVQQEDFQSCNFVLQSGDVFTRDGRSFESIPAELAMNSGASAALTWRGSRAFNLHSSGSISSTKNFWVNTFRSWHRLQLKNVKNALASIKYSRNRKALTRCAFSSLAVGLAAY
jgi:hypothetical protein